MGEKRVHVARERSPRIEVHPDYLRFMAKMAFDKLGRPVAETLPSREIARQSSLDKNAVLRFFGGAPTESVARKLCAWLDIPYPILSIANPEEVRLIEALRASKKS